MRLPAFLFDLDGVLVRSEEIWFRVVEAAGVRFRDRAITRDEFFPTFGQGTTADVQVFGLRCSVAELDRFYVEHFGRHTDAVWIDPDAAHVLATLRKRGHRIAVVTNTVSPLARQIVASARIQPLLDALVCADQVAHAKPAPDLLLRALELLGVTARDAWMIGDSRYDHEAARAAQVPFIGYRRDGDLRIEALSELLDLPERRSPS